MSRLAELPGVTISQKKEWGEILSGFETINKYMILEPAGNELYAATEEGGSTLQRIFLKSWRPFEIKVREFHNLDDILFSIKRPFKIYFHEAVISNKEGAPIGKIKREFDLLRKKYTITDEAGGPICTLFGPIFHPWTFEIKENGQVAGKITKKWSGVLKEAFTDADNFGIEFPPTWDEKKKTILLGTVFLIDFVHFENKGKH